MSARTHETAAGLSSAQLSDLALDAAIEVQDFMAGGGTRLSQTKHLLEALISTLNTEGAPAPEGRIDLTYLPIYESAVQVDAGARPQRIGDFAAKVQQILQKFATADQGDQDLLGRLQEFCLAVHEQALSQRLNAIRSNRSQTSYASRPF